MSAAFGGTERMAETEDADAAPPALITPLESGYIRIAIGAALPAINWVIYSTNLDEVLHITKLTTNQVWQAVNAALTVASVILVIWKRIKEGKDPNSTAPQIVLSKPTPPASGLVPPPFELPPQQTAPPPGEKKTDEQLIADYKARIKMLMQKPKEP